jgi:plasmid stability protein
MDIYQMANVNVRNLPDEVHRAIRIQAAHHGRSTEAEIRDILERAAKPEGRVKLGSLLASIAREFGGLTDEEHALFERARIKSPARAVSLE